MPYRSRLSAPRSFLRMAVDPISNTIAITKANPAYAPRQPGAASTAVGPWGKTLADGALADELIWPILHEFTHHGSLHTPVGTSLSALAVSHTSTVGSLWEDADRLLGPARDVIRSAASNLLLRPLMEGMALFAEFDAVSGDVPIATWSSQVGGMLFCLADLRRALLAGEDVLSPLKTKLEKLRLSAEAVARKKELLAMDLLDPGGYLLGYLLIKALWVDLTTRQAIWCNSDMFIMFINDYFFGDFFLAQLLVQQPELSVEDEIGFLETYLHTRVVELAENSGRYGKEFAQYYLTPGAARPSYYNHSEPVEAYLRLEWAVRTIRAQHWQTPDFINARGIPRVLAAPAMVSIDKAGNFEAHFQDGTMPIMGPVLEIARPLNGEAVEGEGSVEAIVLLPQNGQRATLVFLGVFLDKELLATFDPATGRFNEEETAKACDKMASYLAIESFAMQVDEELHLPEGTAVRKLLESYSGEAGIRRMLGLWGPFALIPDVGEPDRPTAMAKLESGGLKAALSLDNASLANLARTSLQPLGFALQSNDNTGTSEQGWLDDANAKSTSLLGFRLILMKDGKLEPSRM
jgi:hypothetical protein